MSTLHRVLESFDPFVLLRDTSTKTVRTAAGWSREDGALDPGRYERQRHRGAPAVMRIVAGANELALVEVHAEHTIHSVIGRLEPELRKALEECIPPACREAQAEVLRAAPYVAVTRVQLEGYALTALFAYAYDLRSQSLDESLQARARPQLLWTPELREWLLTQMRWGIRTKAQEDIAAALSKADRWAERERHATNLAQANGLLLEQLCAQVNSDPGSSHEVKADAQRNLAVAKRARSLVAC